MAFYIVYILLGIICVLLYRFYCAALLEVRGPWVLPVVGCAFVLKDLRNSSKSAAKVLAQYGELVRLNLPQPLCITSNPEILKQILSSDYEVWQRDPELRVHFQDVMGGISFLENGEEWQFVRGLYSKTFSHEQLTNFAVHIRSKTMQLVSAIKPFADRDHPCDLLSYTSRFAFDVACIITLGFDFEGLTSDRGAAVEKAWRYVMNRNLHRYEFMQLGIPYYKLLPWHDKQYLEHLEVIRGLIRDRLRRHDQSVSLWSSSILGKMMEDPRSKSWSEERKVTELCTLLAAGHETTAPFIAVTLHQIATNATVERTLLNELSSQGSADLETLPYLKAVLTESLRLHPPAPSNHRILAEDRTLHWKDEKDKPQRFTFKVGTRFALLFCAQNWNDSVFPDPEQFRPERHLGRTSSGNGSFIPFGGGPRRCLGEKLALAEARNAISALLTAYSFTSVEKIEIEQRANLYVANGVKMVVKNRP